MGRFVILYIFCCSFTNLAYGQYTLSGKVELCPDFTTPTTYPGLLVYKKEKQKKRRKTKKTSSPKILDTLIASLRIYQDGQFLKQTHTDRFGQYSINFDESGIYRITFDIAYYLRKEYSIQIDSSQQILNACISDSAFHERFLSQIPYTKEKAIEDILAGKIQVILLGSDSYLGSQDSILDADQEKEITNKYGFTLERYYIEGIIPSNYLMQRQDEYNQVVYTFLNVMHQMDVESAVKLELRNKAIEVLKDRYAKD